MLYSWLADVVLLVHLGFIVFVGLGALAAWRWPKLVFVHLPCAAWGVVVELAGWTCPLTPLEISLRRRAGQQGWEGDFIAHYLEKLVYPAGLQRSTQILLGLGALIINAVFYTLLWRRGRRGRSTSPGAPPSRT